MRSFIDSEIDCTCTEIYSSMECIRCVFTPEVNSGTLRPGSTLTCRRCCRIVPHLTCADLRVGTGVKMGWVEVALPFSAVCDPRAFFDLGHMFRSVTIDHFARPHGRHFP